MPATRPEKPITRQEIKRLIRQRANVSTGGSSGGSSGSSDGDITEVIAGTALDGGGTSGAVTIDHADTAVTPGTFGDATNVAQITVDQQGHITAVTEVSTAGTSTLDIEDEGTPLGTFGTVNFAGLGVTATDAGGSEALVTIPGLVVEDEGSSTVSPCTRINFVGSNVTVTDAGSGEATVTVGGSTDPFYIPPVAADFTTSVTNGTVSETSFTDASGSGLSYAVSMTSAGGNIMRLKAIPADPYTVTIRFVNAWQQTCGSYAGLVIRDSGDGDLEALVMHKTANTATPTLRLVRVDGATVTTISVIVNAIGAMQYAHTYFQVSDDGAGNITWRTSADGVNFHTFTTTTLAAHVGTADQIGFFQGKATNNGTAETASMMISYYDE